MDFKRKALVLFLLFLTLIGLWMLCGNVNVVHAKVKRVFEFEQYRVQESSSKERFEVYIDKDTECEYIVVLGAPSITPRLDRNGQPMCYKQKMTNKLPK